MILVRSILKWIFTTLLIIVSSLHANIFLIISAAAAATCPPHERDALLDFMHHAVEEDPAGHWLSSWVAAADQLHNSTSSENAASLDCCLWNGVMCDEQGLVIGIDLNNCVNSTFNTLRGQLNPDALRALAPISRLSHLDFGCHSFHGPIAAEIGNLTSLTFLRLHKNNMSGLIPASMRYLTSLQHVGLAYNHFLPQPFPSSLLHPSLISLNLYFNSFTGPIPDVFMNLTRIEILNLYNNDFSGLLPPSLKFLTSASTIALDHNRFSPQEIPSALFQLPSLMALGLSSMNLRGSIPDVRLFANSTKLAFLDLSLNNLEGLIPPWMLYNNSLQGLDLSYNQFSNQQIPSALFFLPFLTILDLSFNNFTGISISSPSSPEAASVYNNRESQLQYLSLASNMLTDSIFDDESPFHHLKNLNALVLRDNQLQGPFPASLNNVMSELLVLDMSRNLIRGQIPSFVRSLKKMKVLELGSNELSGSIPDWIGSNLSQELRILVLSGNNLSGAIPASLGLLTAMKSFKSGYNNTVTSVVNGLTDTFTFPIDISIIMKGQTLTFDDVQLVAALDLSDNQLSGPIPADLGNLTGLVSLNLSRNHLDGEIPDTLGALSHLESLDLSRNLIQGQIPGTFDDLQELGFVNLSSNRLSGSIPTSPHWETFNISSFLDNDGLCTINADTVEGLPTCGSLDVRPSTIAIGRFRSRSADGYLQEMMEWAGFAVGYPLGALLGYLPWIGYMHGMHAIGMQRSPST